MEAMDYWRLCDSLTVRQAALLMMDEDPGDYPNGNSIQNPYEAIAQAMIGAVQSKKVVGSVVTGEFGVQDLYSKVDVESLKAWLIGKGIRSGFFFPEADAGPDYLNKDNPNYSPKLAAAVNAWIAISTGSAYRDNGQSVKSNIVTWLTAHAAEYGLLKDDMSINASAINDQIAVVANFNPQGGAPATPEAKPYPPKSEPAPPEFDDDENIPF